jgi:hypothetical protein
MTTESRALGLRPAGGSDGEVEHVYGGVFRVDRPISPLSNADTYVW